MLLYGDAALERIEVDILGVRDFAVKIAQSMLAQSGNSGLVYGLEGTWGSGKSSLANEILGQVLELHDASKGEMPIVVRFDPWILRGVQPLVGALLEEIKAAILEATVRSYDIKRKLSGALSVVTHKAKEYRGRILAIHDFAVALAAAQTKTALRYLKAVFSSCRPSEGLSCQSSLRLFNHGCEGGGFADCDVAQHFAVDLDAGLQQAVDEDRIGHVMLTGCCVDALDPQSAEVALLGLAVAVSILARAPYSGGGGADGVLPAALEAFSGCQDVLPTGAGLLPCFNTCHCLYPYSP